MEILGAVMTVLFYASWCVLFNREKEEWWKVFIPIYNTYMKYKIYWEAKHFVYAVLSEILFATSVVLGLCFIAAGSAAAIIGLMLLVVSLITIIIYIVFSIKLMSRLAERYNRKSVVFVLGLVLFPSIFLPVVAFDKQIKKMLNKLK